MAALRDLPVFVEEAAEAVTSADLDVLPGVLVGKWPQWCGLAERAVRTMVVEVPFVSANTAAACRWLTMRIRSSSSRRRLPTNRSAHDATVPV